MIRGARAIPQADRALRDSLQFPKQTGAKTLTELTT
jgi:hypothetical protein